MSRLINNQNYYNEQEIYDGFTRWRDERIAHLERAQADMEAELTAERDRADDLRRVLDAERERGTAFMAERDALRERVARLVGAISGYVNSQAFQGICDEECELERILLEDK